MEQVDQNNQVRNYEGEIIGAWISCLIRQLKKLEKKTPTFFEHQKEKNRQP